MNDCPNCEYHRQRAQRWREEVYKLSGYPLPEREWVGLTEDERKEVWWSLEAQTPTTFAKAIEAKLKEKNT